MKKINKICQKVTKNMLQRQNISNDISSRFTPATDLKIGTIVLNPNFMTKKEISKKYKRLQKIPYQIIDKPTEVTYKLIDSSKKLLNIVTTYYLINQKNKHFAK